MEDKATKDEESVETLDGALPDGRTVDVIRDGQTGRLKLIWFDGNQYRTAERITMNGRTFVPPALDPALQRAVSLPTQASDFGCTTDLFNAIRQVLTECGMSLIAMAATYFVFAACFAEPSWPAPCLVVTGPGAEASILLQVLAGLVRRGLRMTEIYSHGFRGLIQRIHPTILIDGRGLTPRSLNKLLACGSRVFAPHKGSVAEFSFARVIYAGLALPEDVDLDGSLYVQLLPARRGIPLLDANQRDQTIVALQAKLLAYRLQYRAKIRASDFDLPDVDLEGRTIGATFGRCIVDAPEIQAGVRALLEGHDDDLRTTRWTDTTCVVIEALLDKCHVPQPAGVYVGKITEAATAILKARGATTQLEDRAVGDCLRKLGFTPKRNGKGYRILVTNGVIQVIHNLARDYRVAAVEHGIARCAVCHQTFGVRDADHDADVQGEPPK